MDALARRLERTPEPLAATAAVTVAAEADTLRLLTCGSVDDGKSTLIGRLLYDCQLIMEDQLAQLEQDSVRHGTTGGLDFALLVDGLEAVVAETMAARTSERGGRLIDREASASMERKKKEGYF